MPASPAGGRPVCADYRPSVKKAQGHVPACLVNASVTYCSNDRIYAFGGFDQYTDEGLTPPTASVPQLVILHNGADAKIPQCTTTCSDWT